MPSLLSLNMLDLIFLLVILASVFFGLKRGLWSEIIAIATWISAFSIAILFTEDLTFYFSNFVKTQFLAELLSFLTLIIATLIVGGLINYIINQLISKTGLGLINRLLGSIFGFVRGVIIVFFISFLLSNTAASEKKWFQEAMTISYLQNTMSWLQNKLITTKEQAQKNVPAVEVKPMSNGTQANGNGTKTNGNGMKTNGNGTTINSMSASNTIPNSSVTQESSY